MKGWEGYDPEKVTGLYPNEQASDFAFLPFGGGQRKCVGDQFAMLEAAATMSLMLKHFDFEKEEIYGDLASGKETVLEVFECTFSFMVHDSVDIQADALHALGQICIRHSNFMIGESKLKHLYIDILVESFYSDAHKIKVLNNLEAYLAEEEVRMRKLDEHCKLQLTTCSHH